MEILVRVDGGLEWKDGDTMHWWVLLTEDYTVCMSEDARPGRARIYAFRFKPPSEHKTQFRAPDYPRLRLLQFINGFRYFTELFR
jgi:hypothetical protein